jgi:hypothetical protein
MTKKEYIQKHPRSYLAKALQKVDWSGHTPIQIIGGQEAPDNPRSNLARALAKSNLGEYVVGGHRQRGSDGWWFAVA